MNKLFKYKFPNVKIVVPAIGTLIVYGEGSSKGQSWSDELRADIAKNSNSIYLHTFKIGSVHPVAKGVDLLLKS